MVREFGSRPAMCHPAAWVPEHLIRLAVHEAQNLHPAVRLQMQPRPDRDGLRLGQLLWRSPDNVEHHATRRTKILMLDDADRLLSVPARRRRDVLDRIQTWEEKVGHALAIVLIGGPALADVVAESRTTQVIRLDAMEGEEFAEVCSMVIGTRDGKEIAALHEASVGLMGRLRHIVRLR